MTLNKKPRGSKRKTALERLQQTHDPWCAADLLCGILASGEPAEIRKAQDGVAEIFAWHYSLRYMPNYRDPCSRIPARYADAVWRDPQRDVLQRMLDHPFAFYDPERRRHYVVSHPYRPAFWGGARSSGGLPARISADRGISKLVGARRR